MLDLTPQQRSSVASDEVVPCVLDEKPCVVIRQDVFERLQRVANDDGELTAEEMIEMAERAFDDADAAGPIV